jgi:hypothetical protein
MNWFDPSTWSGFLSEAQKNMVQPWVAAGQAFKFPGAPAAGTNPMQDGIEKMNDLVKRSMEGWATLLQSAVPGKAGAPFDAATLGKLFDPAEWSKAMASGADLSLERLTEGPTYATPTDIDRRIRKAQQLWLERARDIEGYRQVLQAAWARAFEQMMKELNDTSAPPLTSARAVLDLWLSVANEQLIEMHHRPEFLEAQRRMTRTAAAYRLAEQDLAEVFCTLNHIPTRTEMDEAQKTIVELRREVRALKRRLDQGGQS